MEGDELDAGAQETLDRLMDIYRDPAPGQSPPRPDVLMCCVCHYAIPCLDDVAVETPSGYRICLWCFEHDTGTGRTMTKEYRRQWVAAAGQE